MVDDSRRSEISPSAEISSAAAEIPSSSSIISSSSSVISSIATVMSVQSFTQQQTSCHTAHEWHGHAAAHPTALWTTLLHVTWPAAKPSAKSTAAESTAAAVVWWSVVTESPRTSIHTSAHASAHASTSIAWRASEVLRHALTVPIVPLLFVAA